MPILEKFDRDMKGISHHALQILQEWVLLPILEKFDGLHERNKPSCFANIARIGIIANLAEPKIEITNIEGYQYRGIPVVIKLWTS